ncbi:MAG: cytochrome c biogenesis protein CcsA [Burkholderiaceae bacterium]|jgi:ABC-type uncharacterized transport system permease subunit|nr:cytochrome c biogenesis protein CcsA [Burkholderiaceae bacterium]MDP4668994.1 cytochrome c biogenesis protein CcsA [Burkholderiaceae bacterium]MDP4800862.1 cytochrome c biogenesis protein CcsA [Burkholderiaceae bacterium]
MSSSLYGVAPWLAAAGYCGLFWARHRSDGGAWRLGLHGLMGLTLVLQGSLLLPEWFSDGAIRFGFAPAVSWMLWLAVMLLWIESWFHQIPRPAISIFPLAALAVLLPGWFPGVVLLEHPSLLFRGHILFAMLAYSCFAIASGQALLMLAQEKALHRAKLQEGWWTEMPPLLEMDQTLLRITMVGFGLLTLTLATGMVVNLNSGLDPLRFDHKTLFTVLTWLMVGVFLAGRGRMGWRGRVAARFVLGGFAMLLLAYVGSRFVLEIFITS